MHVATSLETGTNYDDEILSMLLSNDGILRSFFFMTSEHF